MSSDERDFNCPIVPRPRGGTNETIKSATIPERDDCRDAAETMSLKALARRHFERDKRRDRSDTSLPSRAELEAASDAAFAATERAAIIAERRYGTPRACVPHNLPPYWGDIGVIPTPGARCLCCRGTRWWCEAAEPKGWRCAVCHPHIDLAVGIIREVVT
jgi:hypothetical protein